ADVCAAEGVDRLVGVADGDQVATVAGECAQQAHLGGVGVLVFVDEDVAVAGAQLLAQAGVGVLGQRHGLGDDAGVVEEVLRLEHLVVLRQEVGGRDQLRPALGRAQVTQAGDAEALLLGAREHGGHRAGEPAGAARLGHRLRPEHRLRSPRQQLADDHVPPGWSTTDCWSTSSTGATPGSTGGITRRWRDMGLCKQTGPTVRVPAGPTPGNVDEVRAQRRCCCAWARAATRSARSMPARSSRSMPARCAAARTRGLSRSGARNSGGRIVRSTAAYARCWRASCSACAAAVRRTAALAVTVVPVAPDTTLV